LYLLPRLARLTFVANRLSRKRVTVLFCDLVESSELFDRLDPEALRAVADRYYGTARTAVERHGGTVEKYIGDAVMAVFGIPIAHEDDAERAVRAALEMRAEVAALGLVPRIGIETGEVVAGDPEPGHAFVTGPAIVVAERLQKEAGAHGVLAGESTYRLVRDAVTAGPEGALELKGRPEPVNAWRIHDANPEAPGLARRLDTPLVGRARELEVLQEELRRVEEQGRCHLTCLVGPAGVGKSRLTLEFVGALPSERVLSVRCPRYGEGATFRPVADLVRLVGRDRVAGLVADPRATAVLDALAGGTLGSEANELPWALRRLLEALAADGPLVVVLEDVESAEPPLLDLIDHVVRAGRGSVLLVCAARTELLEQRPAWTEHAMWLEPLDVDESARLLAELAGAPLEPRVADRIAEAAGGNALFAEELLRMLVEDGRLRRSGDRWVSTEVLGDLAPPESVQAVIAARLDHLEQDDRFVLQAASVVGQEFSRDALASLDIADGIEERLARLVSRQLVRPPDTPGAAADTFVFAHPLVREVAYASLTKRERADLHERYARLVASRGTALDLDEVLGHHLYMAVRSLRDLDPGDARVGSLAAEAVPPLEAAGRRAAAQRNSPGAAALLQRAVELVPQDDPRRLELLLQLAEALRSSGRLEEADDCLQETKKRATAAGATLTARRADAARGLLSTFMRPSDGLDAFIRAATELIAVAREEGDDVQVARAWLWLGWALWPTGRLVEMEHATAEARLLGATGGRDVRGETRRQLALGTVYGPSPVPEALRLCHELEEEALSQDDDRWAAVAISVFRSFAEAHAGDFAGARATYEAAGPLLEELGTSLFLTSQRFYAGRVELLAGEPAAAEAHFRDAIQLLEALGDRGGNRAGPLVFLAEALHARGADDEAAAVARSGLELGNPDDLENQIQGRAILAELLAESGDTREVETLVREAVELSDRTDSPLFRADARRALAVVSRAAGSDDTASTAAGEALKLYEEKGSVAGAELIRRLPAIGSVSAPERTGATSAAPAAARPDPAGTR
jgi:class 3 adenylate cyclase/tetratricopeptide (TPR) repeat protein